MLGGFLLWIFRKSILRFIIQRIEIDLKNDTKIIKDELTDKFRRILEDQKKETQKIFKDQLKAFDDERNKQRMLVIDIKKYLLDSSEDNLKEEQILGIRNSTDGTLNSIFVEAKLYFLDKCKESVVVSSNEKKYNDTIKSLSKTKTIFDAIVRKDSSGNLGYFQSRAFLSYALFYQNYPKIKLETIDLSLSYINDAIKLRDKSYNNRIPKNSPYHIYELKRAIFNIIKANLDKQITIDSFKEEIFRDLNTSCVGYYRLQKILEEIINNIDEEKKISDILIGDYLSKEEVSVLTKFLRSHKNYCGLLELACFNISVEECE